ncbi:MAG: gluconate 2-dehydrogenase subunit 3 family protein [Bacteroidetes bacterium]|nr:gluconate 2-dehydrogenase subunit 3 family protein [Bacteroidota bacterium]MDA1019580.1 gluconate 2-dehydrogenase subunit 3 family protein [Bacteroidota bacterium]
MNRRDLLKKVGLGVGTLAVTPLTVSLFQSCQSDLDWNPIFFKEYEINFSIELSDLIIPSSKEIPGAKELDLIKFVDTYISKVLSSEEQKVLRNSFKKFKLEYLKNSEKSNLNDINLNSIVKLLDYYLLDNKSKYDIWTNDFMTSNDSLCYLFLNSFRKLLITAFKTNQYIGENVLAFSPIPGEQKGCVDLLETTNGKAWTI